MPTLIEIAKLEEIVLCDSSALGLRKFTDAIYPVKRYAQFDKGLLVDANRAIMQFLEFLQQPNTHTDEAALEDFENLNRIMGSKQRFLNQRRNPDYDDRCEEKETLFSDASEAIFSVLRLARAKVFRPEDAHLFTLMYEELPHLYLLATSSGKLPQKYRQLYAAAFYLTFCKKVSVALTVSDWQFEVGLKLLVEKAINRPESHAVLHQSPIKVYNFNNGGIQLTYTTQNEKSA